MRAVVVDVVGPAHAVPPPPFMDPGGVGGPVGVELVVAFLGAAGGAATCEEAGTVVASGAELTLVDPHQFAGLAILVAVPGRILGEVVADGSVVSGEAVAVAFDCAVACRRQVPDCFLWCRRFGPHRSSFPPIEHKETRFRRDNTPRNGTCLKLTPADLEQNKVMVRPIASVRCVTRGMA